MKLFNRRKLMKLGGMAGLSAAALELAIPQLTRVTKAQTPQRVRIGYLPVNVELAAYSESVNFWKEDGLDVQFVRADGGPAILQALASGDLPVGDFGLAPAVVSATKGFPFYFLTLMTIATPDHPLDRIMVLMDSPIKKFQDLSGKTLAINQLGTMPDAALGAAGKVYGLAKDKIRLVPIPYPNMPQVLAQKQVDAIYPFPPGDSIAEVRFNARTLTETKDFIPYLGFTTLAVHRDFASGNPETVKKLVRGAIKTDRWIGANPDDARTAANKFLNIPEDVASKVRMPYFAENGLSVMANVWHIYYLLASGGVITPVDDPGKMMNEFFIEPTKRFTLPAVEELGIVPDKVVSHMLRASYPMLPKPVEEYYAPWDHKFL
jgi:NitT/TauT family transport system substrate-binding protein